MTTELSVIERASVALGASEIEKKLTELAKQSKEIVTITNIAGYEQCHASRMVLKNERISLQKLGKDARDDATKFSKAIIAEEGRLTSIISLEEDRLAALQKTWDDAREAEKQAKIQAEMKRVSDIQLRLKTLRDYPNSFLHATSGDISFAIDFFQNSPLESFEEFAQEANETYEQSLVTLNDLLEKALKREEEQRIANEKQEALKKELAEQEEANRLERLELAKLRAEQQARDAEELQRRAAENARIDAERKLEFDRISELKRVEQERIDTEDRRIAKERLKLADEARVIREAKETQERVALEAIRESERKTAEKRDLKEQQKIIAEAKCKTANEALVKILAIVNNFNLHDAEARLQIGVIAEVNLQTKTA